MLKHKKLRALLALLTMLASLAAPASAAEAANAPPGQEETAAAPASLFPLEELELEPVNLSGKLPDELRAVPLSALLGEAGQHLDEDVRLAWRFLDSGSYAEAGAGDTVDLSSLWTGAVSQTRLEILVPGDPTDPEAVRCIVPIQAPSPKNLLKITAWSAAGEQIADQFSCVYWDDPSRPQFTGSANTSWNPEDGALLKMEFSSIFQDLTGVEVRVYCGSYSSLESIPPDAEVTGQIWGSETAGYGVELAEDAPQFTLTAARAGQTILVMPFSLTLAPYSSVYVGYIDLFDPATGDSVLDHADDGTLTLREGVAPDGLYHLRLKAVDHSWTGGNPFDQPSLASIDAAYVGSYVTKAAAEAAGSANIAGSLFETGYGADYSRGVVLTIFDKYGGRHLRRFQTQAYAPGEADGAHQDEPFRVTGAAGDYDAYCVGSSGDSFRAAGWQTVFLLNRTEDPAGKAVTAEQIRPVFTTGQDVSVYSGHDPSGPVQISGVTEQPFLSGEALPYLAVTEQGERLCRVTFVTQQAGGPALFINGVTNSGSRDEAGIFHISPDMDREGFYDFLTANTGDKAMTNLRVSLRGGKNVRLDDYWNFGAARSLAAFTSAEPLTASGALPQYGALFNLTKLRLVKTGDGEPTGILTISADGIEPVIIRLPGQLDLPAIVTGDLPDGALNSPYSHRLQIQVPEGWEDAVFSPASPLPNGLELRPDGELCGTPKVSGVFQITVKLSSGGIACDQKTFSLEIADSADPPPPEDPNPPEEPVPPEEPAPPEDFPPPLLPDPPSPPSCYPPHPVIPSTPEPPVAVNPAPPENSGESTPEVPQPDPGSSIIPPFVDVSPADWFYEDVLWARRQELMLGDPVLRFMPEQAVSQATIVTVLARMMDVELSRYDASPSVPPDMWYTQAAVWAQRAGLLPDNQTFSGAAPISRQDLAIMLNNYLISMGVPAPGGGSVAFEDADQMSEAGRNAFQSLYRHGIFKGVGGLRMDPAGTTTRAQFATLLHRISDFMRNYSAGD